METPKQEQTKELNQLFETVLFHNLYEKWIRSQPMSWQYPFIEIIAGTHNLKIHRTKEFLKAQEIFIKSIKWN